MTLKIGVLIAPLLIFLYVAIATGIISNNYFKESCFQGSKHWLMTDCIIMLSLIPEFLINSYLLNEKIKKIEGPDIKND
jgi:hypothetical protein